MQFKLSPVSKKSSPEPFPKRPGLVGRWGGPALIASVFAALTVLTWHKWADILVDFGREVYVPWKLSTGMVLYKDIAYLNGPFSPYFNALLFRIFGASLTAIFIFNLSILAVITSLIYIIFTKSCDRFTGVIVSIIFLCVFGFAQYDILSNYNYVSPYSHELTHGILLSLITICIMTKFINSYKISLLPVAAICCGFILLGKSEVFVPIFFTVIGGFLMCFFLKVVSWPKIIYAAVVFIISMFLPALLFFLYFSRTMPASEAIYSMLGSWKVFAHPEVLTNFFYRHCSGFDTPAKNLFIMLQALAGVGLLTGFIFLVTAKIPRWSGGIKIILIVPLLAAALFIENPSKYFITTSPWLMVGRSLPIFTLLTGGVIFILLFYHRSDKETSTRLIPLALWSLFAFGLLSKILLSARVGHYGFVLGMPAMLLWIAGLLWLLPWALRRKYALGKGWRLIITIFLMIDLLILIGQSAVYYEKKNFTIGDHGDTIITYKPGFDPRGPAVKELLEYIASSIPEEAGMLVMPEGVMINYLSRRNSPTPFINLMPVEMHFFREDAILNYVSEHPPDYILVVQKDTKEYGVGNFGEDFSYGKAIMMWVERNYHPVKQILSEPLWSDFNITVMKRKN